MTVLFVSVRFHGLSDRRHRRKNDNYVSRGTDGPDIIRTKMGLCFRCPCEYSNGTNLFSPVLLYHTELSHVHSAMYFAHLIVWEFHFEETGNG